MTVYTHNAYVPHLTHYVTDHLSNLHGEIRPVGIAQHNSARTSFYSRQQAGHRVFRVVGVSLKEVLSIVDDFLPTMQSTGRFVSARVRNTLSFSAATPAALVVPKAAKRVSPSGSFSICLKNSASSP